MKINGKVIVPKDKEILPGISVYTKDGALKSGSLRVWMGEAVTDVNGNFTVDWSAAKFTAAPMHVSVTAVAAAQANVYERVWATMNSSFNMNTGSGYALKGANGNIVLGGSWTSIRLAASIRVLIMAWGIVAT